jgi:hypothetical protein
VPPSLSASIRTLAYRATPGTGIEILVATGNNEVLTFALQDSDVHMDTQIQADGHEWRPVAVLTGASSAVSALVCHPAAQIAFVGSRDGDLSVIDLLTRTRFRVSGFGFRVSGFGFRVSGSGFRVLGFGFLVWA